MPTYEYECEKCGYKFEKFQQMSAVPVKKCPECGGQVKRLLGIGSEVIFKGKGFYSTDYKKGGASGGTCCGRSERCENPPCSDDGICKK